MPLGLRAPQHFNLPVRQQRFPYLSTPRESLYPLLDSVDKVAPTALLAAISAGGQKRTRALVIAAANRLNESPSNPSPNVGVMDEVKKAQQKFREFQAKVEEIQNNIAKFVKAVQEFPDKVR